MKIKRITPFGKQKTYNITMRGPHHNYQLANDLISANSHSVGYAHTTYACAFLKANYPAEFWGAVLSSEAGQDNINKYIREATNMGIRILPVDVNKSTMRYEVEDVRTIRRDLTSLKGVGAKAVEDILEKRPFKNMVDFLARTNTKRVTSRVITTLIKAGAFDHAFENEKHNRKTYFDYFDDCRKKIKRYIKRHENIEGFTYDWSNPINIKKRGRGKNAEVIEMPVERGSKDNKERWSNSEVVRFETEIYGVPVTYNIFDFHKGVENSFKQKFRDSIHHFDEPLDLYEHQDHVHMMVIVKGLIKKTPYRKDPRRYTRRYLVEDRTGEGIITVFDRTFHNNVSAWTEGNTLVLDCIVNVYQGRKGLVLDKVIKNCGSIDGRM